MRTIIILNDTLRCQNLSVYNKNTSTLTPNYNQIAKDCVVFDNHYCGSMPCMPARRDLMTGRLNFMERSWGPIEIIDNTFPRMLHNAGIRNHMITDHAHYFRIGGENYCQQFSTYEFFRGQESDPWVSLIDDPYMPKDYFGVIKRQYQCNKTRFKEEHDYSSVKCFDAAIDWVNANKGADNCLLMVETFDPHEPFDMPKKYLDLYHDHYEGPFFDLPKYHKIDEETQEAMEHLNRRYQALITMTDYHLGRFIQALKDNDMYDDTLIIFTTDHGYCMGEHGYLGKNYMPYYNELAHIPLMIHLPKGKHKGEHRNSITQNIDIMPTILQLYGLPIPPNVQGHSLFPVLTDDTPIKDCALYGAFGLSINIFDGQYTYLRGPRNNLCFEYTTSLTTIRDWLGKNNPENIEIGRFLNWTNMPVYKVPSTFNPICNDPSCLKADYLFDVNNDAKQLHNLQDPEIIKKMEGKLIQAMQLYGAPEEQYKRMGLV